MVHEDLVLGPVLTVPVCTHRPGQDGQVVSPATRSDGLGGLRGNG